MTHTATGRSGRVTFQVPDLWTVETPERDEIDALAYLRGPEGTFAPNAVLTVNPYEGSIAQFSIEALDSLHSTLDSPVIIDVRPWEPGEHLPDSPAAAGRVITYTHRSPQTGATLRGAEWLVTGHGIAAQLTTTTDVAQWAVFAPDMVQIAASITFTGTERPSAPVQGAESIPEQAQDPLLTALTETPIERIDGLARLQPYPNEGPWIHGSSLALLSEMSQGRKIGRLETGSYREQLTELQECGFVAGRELSEDGKTLSLFMSEAQVSVRVTAHYGSNTPSFQAWVVGDAVLVTASTSYVAAVTGERDGQPSPDHFNVQIVPLDRLTTLMAQWVGLQPAWTVPVFPVVVPEDRVQARWSGDETFPEGANETMQALWHEGWFAWDVLMVSPAMQLDPISYLNAGRMGHFSIGTDASDQGSGIAFVPLPSVSILDRLEDSLQSVLFNRDRLVG